MASETKGNDDEDAILERPVLVDNWFLDVDSLIIDPSRGQYSTFVVKGNRQHLVRGNVVAVFVDPHDTKEFASLLLHGVAIVVNLVPLILALHPRDTSDNRITPSPPNIMLMTTQNVFVFNHFGVNMLPRLYNRPDWEGRILGFECPSRSAVPSGIPTGFPIPLPLHLPPPTSVVSESSYKARLNTTTCQNIKVLFLHNAQAYRDFVGAMEDLGSDHVLSAVQRVIPNSLINLVALQPKNLKIFLKLMFQLSTDEASVGKPITTLHLSQFKGDSNFTSIYHITKCIHNLVDVLQSIVKDQNGYVRDIFHTLVDMLTSTREDGLSKMSFDVVAREVNERLVAFSFVLAATEALTLSPEDLAEQLVNALTIDLVALNSKNMRALAAELKTTLASAYRHEQTVKKARLSQDSPQTIVSLQGKPGGGEKGVMFAFFMC